MITSLGPCSNGLMGYFYELKIDEDDEISATDMSDEVNQATCTGSCNICPIVDNLCFD